MKPGTRRLEYERIYQTEFLVLERARATDRTQLDPTELRREFGSLTHAFERLLRQAVRLTYTGDKIEQQLLDVQQNLNAKIQEIEALNKDLHQLNNEKTEFLEILSHDLRSPLSAVLTVLSLLRTEGHDLAPETVDELLATSMESIDGATSLIENILEASQVELGQVYTELSSLDVVALLGKLVQRYQPMAAAKQITLEPPATSGTIMAWTDEQSFSRILDNLLTNAIKYTPLGRRVWVSLSVQDHEVTCEVGDEGPGISADDQAKLFQKYQRLSARPTGKETSIGLGLAIAKGLAEQIGACLWCESKLGQGSRFCLALPLAAADHRGPRNPDLTTPLVPEPTAAVEPPSAPKSPPEDTQNGLPPTAQAASAVS